MLGVMNLLTLTLPPEAAIEDFAFAREHFEPFAEKMGAQLMVLVEGASSTLTHDPSALHARLDALVAALQAQTAAIEGLVAAVAASLPEEPPEPDDGIPQPLSRPR